MVPAFALARTVMDVFNFGERVFYEGRQPEDQLKRDLARSCSLMLTTGIGSALNPRVCLVDRKASVVMAGYGFIALGMLFCAFPKDRALYFEGMMSGAKESIFYIFVENRAINRID